MNKLRRKAISNLSKRVELCSNKEGLEHCIYLLEELLEEEQESFDNIPENLQSSMRAMESEEAIEQMEEALECLQNACDTEDDAEDEFEDYKADAISALDEI